MRGGWVAGVGWVGEGTERVGEHFGKKMVVVLLVSMPGLDSE